MVAVAASFGFGATAGYRVGYGDGVEYGGDQLRHLQNRYADRFNRENPNEPPMPTTPPNRYDAGL